MLESNTAERMRWNGTYRMRARVARTTYSGHTHTWNHDRNIIPKTAAARKSLMIIIISYCSAWACVCAVCVLCV